MQKITHQRKPNLSTSSAAPTQTGERVQPASTSGPPYLQVDPDTRVKLKPLVKRILVSIGHRMVGWPSVRALFTRALSVFGLTHV
jgi:hypothetical protein